VRCSLLLATPGIGPLGRSWVAALATGKKLVCILILPPTDRSLTLCISAILHAPVDTIVHDTSAGAHVSSKDAQ